MFRSFFAALSRLVSNVNDLADSFGDANTRLREQLRLDGPANELPAPEQPQLPAPTSNGGKKKTKVAQA